MSPRDRNDPTRRHPESEDTGRPPPRPIVGGVRVPPPPPLPAQRPPPPPPGVEPPASHRPTWFVHWSPGSIAAAVVAVIVALGGATGLRELIGSGEATRAAIAESEARITAKFEEQRSSETAAHDAINADLRVEHERLILAINLACALNEGAAHVSWPCDLRLTPPPPGNTTPRWVSAKPWPESR